jgi:hypothetical protein
MYVNPGGGMRKAEYRLTVSWFPSFAPRRAMVYTIVKEPWDSFRVRSIPFEAIAMACYRVVLIPVDENWTPASPDDVPPQPPQPNERLLETEDFFSAVREAIQFNQQTWSERKGRWAVVCEVGCPGKTWPGLRICTPLRYKIASIWWPPGWEPNSPLDMPLCICRTHGTLQEDQLSYEQALATIQALNQQAMDRASTMWYVMLAVENEPVSRTISYDPAGLQTTVEIRRLHVAQPAGGGHGDCSHCPARSLDCSMVAPA